MSKPQSHILYARTRDNADDSMTFVRRMLNPMRVRKTNAVNAAPRRVEDRGELAAEG